MAMGYKASPAPVNILVAAGQETPVEFTLRPRTVILGSINIPGTPGREIWKRIETITLTAPNLTRTLRPQPRYREEDAVRLYIAGQDAAFGNSFLFLDMPEGECDITVTAKGCPPATVKAIAKAGTAPRVRLTLTPQ